MMLDVDHLELLNVINYKLSTSL